jgi:hypothetical protein
VLPERAESRRAVMHPELALALGPVLRDLAATCSIELDVRDEDWGYEGPSAMVWEASGSGTGITLIAGQPSAHQIASLADQLQEVATEALWSERLPVAWPQCPSHPDSHPLEAAVVESHAVWRCPKSGHIIANVGALAAWRT